LTQQGIADKVARQLAKRHSPECIAEKIEYLEFLASAQPDQVKNPRGWLRRAIEENYGPPDGFLTLAERHQLAAEQEQQAQAADAYVQASQARAAEQANQAQARRQRLHEQYGTTPEDLAFWQKAQQEIKYASVAYPDLKIWLGDAEILKCGDTTVQIGIRQAAAWRQLGHPGTRKVVQRVLTLAAGKTLVPEFVQLLQADTVTGVTSPLTSTGSVSGDVTPSAHNNQSKIGLST
jgi:hypothetical protein